MIKRILVIIGGLILSLIAAAHAFMIVWYADWLTITAYAGVHGSGIAVLGAVVTYVNSVAFLLFVLVIALAEMFALRSAVFYVAIGLALTLLLRFDLAIMPGAHLSYELLAHGGLILLASGVTLGLVYWAVAGRKAGAWRGDAEVNAS